MAAAATVRAAVVTALEAAARARAVAAMARVFAAAARAQGVWEARVAIKVRAPVCSAALVFGRNSSTAPSFEECLVEVPSQHSPPPHTHHRRCQCTQGRPSTLPSRLLDQGGRARR
eukprot:3203767-Prymnesium_polylepis.1